MAIKLNAKLATSLSPASAWRLSSESNLWINEVPTLVIGLSMASGTFDDCSYLSNVVIPATTTDHCNPFSSIFVCFPAQGQDSKMVVAGTACLDAGLGLKMEQAMRIQRKGPYILRQVMIEIVTVRVCVVFCRVCFIIISLSSWAVFGISILSMQ